MNCDHTKYILAMKTFWEYINKFEEASEPQIAAQPTTSSSPVANASNVPAPTMGSVPQPEVQGYHPKLRPWKAKKSEIVRFWKALAPNIPLQLEPIDSFHKGSTVQEDTLRITGSKEFITTVISRLKDFVIYENPDTKLVLDYRQNQKSLRPGSKNSYLFYINVRKRK